MNTTRAPLATDVAAALRRPASGFTLLEMMVVLFIMILLLGIAIFSFTGVQEREVIVKPAAELKRMAREAVGRAGLFEEPQMIVFEKDGFAMRYRGDASATATGADPRSAWTRRVQVPENMVIKIRRWGTNQWQPATGQRWMVLPSGLCEPIGVRMELGRSFVEMQFNPLTGGVAEEVLNIAS